MKAIGWAGIGALILSVTGAAAALSADKLAEEGGARVYRENCAMCHGVDLDGPTGPNPGSVLKGAAFIAKWKGVPAAEFLTYVHSTMPFNQPGALDAATSAKAANFVLAQNGLPQAAAGASNTLRGEVDFTMPIQSADRDEAYRKARAARAALLGRLSPVDDARATAPAPSDWLGWRGAASTQAYSRLDQIDRRSVGDLGLAWALSLDPGTNGIAPIVHDGVMFVHSNGTVQALDARDGEMLWQYARPAKPARIPVTQPRGIALYGDTLYVPTVDNHMLALDAKTGKLRWDRTLAPEVGTFQLSAAPLAIRGKIIQGVSGCSGTEAPGGCYIVALDANTGEQLWRFDTIARPGAPGGDSWNGAPLEKRFGGSVWTTGSYDAGTGLVYLGVAQTYIISTLLDDQGRRGKSNDALYTNSTLALDPDTGKLVWHYQHSAGEVWDLDWAFERTLATVDGPKGPRRIIVTGGKMGIFDAIDAKTGRYLWSVDLGYQNLVIKIDPKTGAKTYDPALYPRVGPPVLICPSAAGNRNWMATSYDPERKLLFVPVTPTCMDFSRADGKPTKSITRLNEMTIAPHRRPDSDGHHGVVAAIDVANGKLSWKASSRAPETSATLATAGGLVFAGGRDRAFRALDSDSGQTLWQVTLPAPPNAFPLSYAVDGRQYVAVVTGGGSVVDAYQVAMTPEYPRSSTAKTIMVFALPRTHSKP